MLKPPSISKAPDERLISTSLGKDFIEIHESTVMYGSPELADHLSGFIYMSVSMYEDKSSQGKGFNLNLKKAQHPLFRPEFRLEF